MLPVVSSLLELLAVIFLSLSLSVVTSCLHLNKLTRSKRTRRSRIYRTTPQNKQEPVFDNREPSNRQQQRHHRAMSTEVAIYVCAFLGMTGIMGVFALMIYRKHQRHLQQNLAHIQVIHDRRQQAIGKQNETKH